MLAEEITGSCKFLSEDFLDFCKIIYVKDFVHRIPYRFDNASEIYMYPEILNGCDCEDKAIFTKALLQEVGVNITVEVMPTHAYNLFFDKQDEKYLLIDSTNDFIKNFYNKNGASDFLEKEFEEVANE
jgi:hypothetical protein